ncbi:MAG TPA: tetratricopeptide repeat protein [Pyrinomonadaceae bacterium]|nr:tetratricopeptide repeat protein [Pyrinomonadaceae bacterium]
MFIPAPLGRARRPSWARLSLALVVILLPLGVARAQGVGSTRDLPSTSGGRHVIQGRVYLPDGKPGTNVKIKLESNNFIGGSTMTDSDGNFRFSGLEAGSYTVRAEVGREFEMAMESVAIDREITSGPRTLMVPIYLRFKGTPAGANPATSNPGLAGVPKPAVELYNQALESGRKGDSKKAVEQLKQAIDLHPDFALALNEMGVQYLKLNQSDKAIEPLSKAVKLTPAALPPRLNYGIALWNMKKFTEAEAELREVLKKSEASQSAHYYLGLALLSQKKMDDALVEFERTAALGKGKDDIAMAHYYIGGILWGKKDYKRAADELESYLRLAPKAPNAEQVRNTIKELRSKQQ